MSWYFSKEQYQQSFLLSLLPSLFISHFVSFTPPPTPQLFLFISLPQRCVPILPMAIPLCTHTFTKCIRVAVIYNTSPLSQLNNSYKRTIDMEMERCSSLAGAACFVIG